MIDLILPDWPAPPNVRAAFTTRSGGTSTGKFASLNLGDHVGDDAVAVAQNRALLQQHLPLPGTPKWLKQVHGTTLLNAGDADGALPGDAAYTRRPNTVCAVLTADCLPLLVADTMGTMVGVIHAGWRGLAAGVIEKSIVAMRAALNDQPGSELLVWLGPAIGPDSFEVGDEVRQIFLQHERKAAFAFTPRDNDKWLANIYLLARQRLAEIGLSQTQIYGGGECTFSDPARFFSYRRDGETGRMAGLIWLAA